MRINLICIGKTDDYRIEELFKNYESRIKKFVNFETKVLPDIKNSKSLPINDLKHKEGELIKKHCIGMKLILLDEKGKEFSSINFSEYISKKLSNQTENICFVIGGPYGFSQDIYSNSFDKISLSKMTFSHQLVRVIFAEQLYRAFSIINNQPYHHD